MKQSNLKVSVLDTLSFGDSFLSTRSNFTGLKRRSSINEKRHRPSNDSKQTNSILYTACQHHRAIIKLHNDRTGNAMSAIDWSAVGPHFQQPVRPGFPKGYEICLRHPGYSDAGNILFYFPAYDHATGGLHLGVALAACGIIVGNKFDGYLSVSAENRADQQVPHHVNQILTANDYYYHPHPAGKLLSLVCGIDNHLLIVDRYLPNMLLSYRPIPSLPLL